MAEATSVATRQSVEPPEVISYSIRNQQQQGRCRRGGGYTSCDPPEQSLASHFANRSAGRNVGSNSVASTSVGLRQKPDGSIKGKDVYVERGRSALETHLSRDHSARVTFADACLQSTRTGGRSNASIGGASTEPHWRDRRVSSVCSEQSRSSIDSRGKQKHSYLQTNAALLAVVSGVVILFTLVIYGSGGFDDGGGIDAKRTLNDTREPAKGIVDNVQLVAQSPGAVSTDGESEEVDPMQLNDVNIPHTTDQGQVPPHLRAHDSKMMKDKGEQQQQKPQPQPQQTVRQEIDGEVPQVRDATQPFDKQLPTSELEVPSAGKEIKKEGLERNGPGVQPGQQKMLKVDPKVKEQATQRLKAANQREQAAQELLKVNEASPKTGEQRVATGDEVGGRPEAQQLGQKDQTEAKLPQQQAKEGTKPGGQAETQKLG